MTVRVRGMHDRIIYHCHPKQTDGQITATTVLPLLLLLLMMIKVTNSMYGIFIWHFN